LAVQIIINQAMLIERDRYLKAERYERTLERTSYANGFKPKQLKPGLENLNYPFLKPVMVNSSHRLRSERASKELDERLEAWRNQALIHQNTLKHGHLWIKTIQCLFFKC